MFFFFFYIKGSEKNWIPKSPWLFQSSNILKGSNDLDDVWHPQVLIVPLLSWYHASRRTRCAADTLQTPTTKKNYLKVNCQNGCWLNHVKSKLKLQTIVF